MIIQIKKEKIAENDKCFYCGSKNTITYSYKGLFFEIECNNCDKISVF